MIRSSRGTNLGGANAHNRRVVIDALRINGALSRAALARATALTGQTVSNIIAELESSGLVVAGGPIRAGRGQPATPYSLLPGGAYALGVQIDRHCVRTVVVDLLGHGLVKREAALPVGGPEAGMSVVLAQVAEARDELAEREPRSAERLVGLGLAMPGPFGTPGDADDPWMMSAWQNFPLVETLAAGTELEVVLQNDASAAATAERLSGVAGGLDDFVYLYLGYGLGAGIVVGGEIFAGAHRNAGEIGMVTPFEANPVEGARLEHQASLATLCRMMAIDPADPQLFDRIEAAMDSETVKSWLDGAAPRLRWTVQMLELVLDPETIVLGGSAPPRLIEALHHRMLPLLPSHVDRPDRSLPRLLLGQASCWMVALGAAAEPISRAFDPRFSAIQKVRTIA